LHIDNALSKERLICAILARPALDEVIEFGCYLNKVLSERFAIEGQAMSEKASVTLTGMVEKVVQSPLSSTPDQAQIAIEGADHQYEAILIENTLTDKSGNEVQLRPGAEVKVTINAEPEAILFRT
jgi:hypothetical protein